MENSIIIYPKFPIKETVKAHLKFFYQGAYFKRMLLYIVIFIAILAINIYNKSKSELLFSITPLALLIILVFTHFTIKKRTKAALENNPRIKEDVQFIFDKNSFTEKGQTFEVKYVWSEYIKVKETKAYFYLYRNKRNAVIIRKDDFEDQLQIDDFKKIVSVTGVKTIFN